MQTAVINVRTDAKIKAKAQKLADSMGFSLSTLVNAYLRYFVKTKTVHFEDRYEPTSYLERAIQRARNDHAQGKTISFSNAKDAVKYIDTMVQSK